MASFLFRWEHPAEDVHVTGTFDNWTKSVELKKGDTGFEKLVSLPSSTDKILYKFVIDGTWIHDHTAKIETDHEGNINNVLFPEDLGPAIPMEHTTSSVAPGATTTALAGEVPLEKQDSLPGAFPETPAADLSSDDAQKDGLSNAGASAGETISNAGTAAAAGIGSAVAAGAAALGISHATSESKNKEPEESVMSVNPIPASQGTGNPITLAPGEKVPEASTIHSNTISSTVRDDPELVKNDQEKAFGVAPLPATGGIGNPITLAPGEKVPETSAISASTLDSHVKLDKASYEKSDSGAPVLPAVVTPQSERDATGAALFSGLGPQTTNMIPESSMGMGADVPPSFDGTGATISSVGANSTTNELAGKQPILPRGVPVVVSESQHEAHVGPEASANPEAVQEKKEMESELKSKVPEDSSAVTKGTDGVPTVVTDSQHKAHVDPEASGSPRAVQEKNEVENELKSKVPEEEANTSTSNGGLSTGGIAAAVTGGLATAGAAAAGATLALNQKAKDSTGTDAVSALPASVQNSIHDANKASDNGAPVKSSIPAETASAVPSEVQQSQKEAHVAPEASANAEAVTEKSEVEKELLAKVPTAQESGEPAPTATAATSTTAPVIAPVPAVASTKPPTSSSGAPQLADPVGTGLAPISMDEKSGLNAPATSPAQVGGSIQSRDVSPMTKPSTTGQTAPVVTSGVTSSEVPAVQSSAPVGTPRNKHQSSASTSTPTSNKRNSIIDRLKGSPSTGESPKAGSDKEKKKGLFSRIKEKLKN